MAKNPRADVGLDAKRVLAQRVEQCAENNGTERMRRPVPDAPRNRQERRKARKVSKPDAP